MRISMARGDLYTFTFGVDVDGVEQTTVCDYAYFSVKKRYTDRDVIFQKKLSDGSILFGSPAVDRPSADDPAGGHGGPGVRRV